MKNEKQAQVFHFDLFGTRTAKYDFLNTNSIGTIDWQEPELKEPNVFFTQKDFSLTKEYVIGFKVDELLILSANGIKTQRDDASIKFTKDECLEIKNDFFRFNNEELTQKYGFRNVRDWNMDLARNDLKNNSIIADKISYRPLDERFMNYTGKTKGIMGYPRLNIMKHLLPGNKNLALILVLQPQAANLLFFDCIFVVDKITDTNFYRRGGPSCFPLYLYPETTPQKILEQAPQRTPNLNMEIVNQIAYKLQMAFVPEKEPEGNVCYINNPEVRGDYRTTFAPIDILDYIYAVLHSPTYREKYKEFLKIDFPRIPYPKDSVIFWQLVELGKQLREIHLLESPKVDDFITTYPIDGDNRVGKIVYEDSKVYINYEKASPSGRLEGLQYFANVPVTAWNFFIGGYQPAQKWLKDRKGRSLSFEDILHYQKIIVALTETDRLMKEIDGIVLE